MHNVHIPVALQVKFAAANNQLTPLLPRDLVRLQVYYADMPLMPGGRPLRRHGDEVQRFGNGYYAALGRCDDTMNLGGIKVRLSWWKSPIHNSIMAGAGDVNISTAGR